MTRFTRQGPGPKQPNLGAPRFRAFPPAEGGGEGEVGSTRNSHTGSSFAVEFYQSWLEMGRAGGRCSGGMLWHTAVRAPVVSFRGRRIPRLIRIVGRKGCSRQLLVNPWRLIRRLISRSGSVVLRTRIATEPPYLSGFSKQF